MNLTCSALLVSLMMAASSFAQANVANAELAELEAKVRQAGPQSSSKPKQDPNWDAKAQALEAVKPQVAAKACANTKMVTLAGKYAVSIENETGKPCRLYDLSFPTLRTVMRAVKISSLPTQKFTTRDYLDFMNGNFEAVQKRMDAYAGPYNDQMSMLSFGEEQVETADWVEKVQFRDERFNMVSMATGRRVLPRSFRASDLEIGSRFVFSPAEQQRLMVLINLLKAAGSSDEVAQAWSQAAKKPESFLQKIKFDWNDAKKAYDVALEGEFLPISGPVTMIDYRAPYKPAIERMIRGLLSSALLQLTNFIPDPLIKNIVYVAIEDASMFIERAYQYQYNQLEFALKGMGPTITGNIDQKMIELSQNLVYAAYSDLFTTYIMSMVKGEKFDWLKMDKIGKAARYQNEKAREISMNQMNSRLVLKSGCKSTIIYDYFADCSKGGQAVGVYSLLSSQSVLFWNLGAPMIYNHKMPIAIPLKRGVAYLLSVGLRLADIGIPKIITNNLETVLSEFSFAGTNDEAFLKSALLVEKQANGGKLSPAREKMLSTLYTFTMNPFLPHSEAREKLYIEANKSLLKIPSGPQSIQPARL